MAFTMEDREEKVAFCKLSEQAERYDDMVKVMNEIAKMPGGLSNDERNLLSVAYKNAISTRRTSWRVLTSQEVREGDEASSTATKNAQISLLQTCEKELEDICSQILDLLDNHLIKSASSNETKVFYLKMKGDYWRYLAEFQKDDKKKKSTAESLSAYEAATKEAESLPAINTVRLGLALNFSVFYFEIEENREEACQIAKEAYQAASGEQGTDKKQPGQTNSRDRILILQLLEDNLNLWSSEAGKPEGSPPDEAKK